MGGAVVGAGAQTEMMKIYVCLNSGGGMAGRGGCYAHIRNPERSK